MNFVFHCLSTVAVVFVASSFVSGDEEISFDDGNYKFWWNVKAPQIEIRLTVKTKGWVGFGISTTASMEGSDLAIGGINGTEGPYYDDYYGLSNTRPLVDDENNWNLTIEKSMETNTHTILTYIRLLNTTDFSGQDNEITDNMTYVIWAYGETDEVEYHGKTKRGFRQINLLTYSAGFKLSVEKYVLLISVSLFSIKSLHF